MNTTNVIYLYKTAASQRHRRKPAQHLVPSGSISSSRSHLSSVWARRVGLRRFEERGRQVSEIEVAILVQLREDLPREAARATRAVTPVPAPGWSAIKGRKAGVTGAEG